MTDSKDDCDVAILGAGLAGMVTALELSHQSPHLNIKLVDQQQDMGGLARSAFGGMALVNTPLQKLCGVKDSPELALRDWYNFAEFSQDEGHDALNQWPKAWAKYYVENSCEKIYHWLKQYGVRFFPVVNWVERGLFTPGNSVPRYHVIWGTSARLVSQIKKAVLKKSNIKFANNTRVDAIHRHTDNWLIETDSNTLTAHQVVIASGGITGKLERVKTLLSHVPEQLLNGSHPSADGHLHDQAQQLGANITHERNMWNYAAGIDHPQAEFEQHGLSLIPCKTALWVNAHGERIGSKSNGMPLVTGFDTHDLCEQVAKQPLGYTWQILNYNIARRELAISGAQHNPHIRDRRWFKFIAGTLTGSDALLKQMLEESQDFLMADSLDQLCEKMNALTQNNLVQASTLRPQLSAFDEQIKRGEAFYTDDQLRRIAIMRRWRADKVRTCRNQTILENGPLIAIRLRLISRKSLGGIQTNLSSQVMDVDNQAIENLYAVGEASGFGGGGASGKRSLEGTFLSGCILTAQNAAAHIAQQVAIQSNKNVNRVNEQRNNNKVKTA